MARTIVNQESVDYKMPPNRFGAWPKFDSFEKREAWLRREYFEYQQYVDLVLKGARDFGND